MVVLLLLGLLSGLFSAMVLFLTNSAMKKPSLSSAGSVRSKCSAETQEASQNFKKTKDLVKGWHGLTLGHIILHSRFQSSLSRVLAISDVFKRCFCSLSLIDLGHKIRLVVSVNHGAG